MPSLTPASAAALARLRAYISPPNVYNSMALSRRAAVLLLLFADRNGNLRVLLTLRSSQLSSFSGQVSLPGGKADSLAETPFDTARREAWEEIGLPQHDLPSPFRVEHLCELPSHMAVSEQVVRPCVAFLHTDGSTNASTGTASTEPDTSITGESLIPKLNATEVAAVFTAPLHRFISSKVEVSGKESPIKHTSKWQPWHGKKWLMNVFLVPRSYGAIPSNGQVEQDVGQAPGSASPYKVWGMTARILVDAARIAYGKDPEFEYMGEIGDESLIQRLLRTGRIAGERKKGSTLPRGQLENEKSKAQFGEGSNTSNKL